MVGYKSLPSVCLLLLTGGTVLSAFSREIPGAGPLAPDGFLQVCDSSAEPVEFVYSSRGLQARLSKSAILLQSSGSRIRMMFQGAGAGTTLHGEGPLAGQVHFITASVAEPCRKSVPLYQTVSYQDLYPGVSARFELGSDTLKSEYLVASQGKPGNIRLRLSGVTSIRLNAQGDLVLATAAGIWREQRPRAWQITPTGKQPVPISWRLHSDGSVGFATGHYNPARQLLIDPTISYSTYIANGAGANQAAATGTAVDSLGNVYVTGWIEGSNLGAQAVGQAVNGGSVDAFLIKLSPSGSLVFATYFGGSGVDQALGVTIGAANQPWITGVTSSHDLPLKNAFQTSLGGFRNAFIAQFSSSGNLLFSSYFGGTGPDSGNAIAADPAGNVYVIGDTQSANLPVKQATQRNLAGGQDAFVAKVTAAGALVYATYLGGSATEHGAAIAVDASANAYLTGGTFSPDFPTHLPLQASLAGASDVFVTKLDSAGNPVYSTYLGGTSAALEQGAAIAVDAQGSAYVAGMTGAADFPTTASAPQPRITGPGNAFVLKLNATGTGLLYSTLLGGTGQDTATGLTIDRFGAACVTGYSGSPDFPAMAPLQTALSGIYDAFITILNPAGSGFYFSSLWGGTGIDSANSVALDSSGNVYVVGQTGSVDYPLTAPLPRAHASGLDAFALKIATDDAVNFVSRVYFGVLGTTPDPAGLALWSGSLNQGSATRGQVALSFFQGAAFQSSGFQVTAAYISVLGRDPDYGGFEFWTGLFRNGALAIPGCGPADPSCSQLGLLNNFMSSPEFQTRFNASGDINFVTIVYQNVLGRAPDSGGLNYWVQRLSQGMTRAQLLQSFINSPEFQNSFGNRIQVQLAYFAFLLRPADPGELQAWTANLNAGGTVAAMLSSLVAGPEFKAGL